MESTNAPADAKPDIIDDKKVEDVGEKRAPSDSELEANHVEYTEAEARKVLSKVDYRLVPILALLYLVAFVDRSNSMRTPSFCFAN